jgi:hypothetical protein
VLGLDVEEAGPLWRAEPFGGDGDEIHRHLSRSVRAFDDRDEIERAGTGDDLLQRQNEPRRGSDVAHVDGARAFARVGEEGVDDLARVAKR